MIIILAETFNGPNEWNLCYFRRHLSTGAPEQVNVDSHARQAAIDGLQDVSPTLFSAAQKQVIFSNQFWHEN